MISIVVAVISTSVSAAIANVPSEGEETFSAESLNSSLDLHHLTSAVSATCVSVTSLSAPNPKTAESLSSLRSLLMFTELEALISTIGEVISTSLSPSISSCPSVLELIDSPVSLNCSAIPELNCNALSATCVSVTSPSAPKASTCPSVLNSTVGVVISSSTSAAISNCPFTEEPIVSAESLNCISLAEFKSNPVSATCVSVTSPSAPKDTT